MEVDLVRVFHVFHNRAFNFLLSIAHKVNAGLIASDVVNHVTIVVVKKHTYSGIANIITQYALKLLLYNV